jgi:hypothetical protein
VDRRHRLAASSGCPATAAVGQTAPDGLIPDKVRIEVYKLHRPTPGCPFDPVGTGRFASDRSLRTATRSAVVTAASGTAYGPRRGLSRFSRMWSAFDSAARTVRRLGEGWLWSVNDGYARGLASRTGIKPHVTDLLSRMRHTAEAAGVSPCFARQPADLPDISLAHRA